jgi:hypothetical protein
MSRRTKERDPATSRPPADARASDGPPEGRGSWRFRRPCLSWLLLTVLVLLITGGGAVGAIPLAVAVFLLALCYQALVWSSIRKLAFRQALASRSGQLGPVIRSLENLRRYVADEEPLPSRGS